MQDHSLDANQVEEPWAEITCTLHLMLRLFDLTIALRFLTIGDPTSSHRASAIICDPAGLESAVKRSTLPEDTRATGS